MFGNIFFGFIFLTNPNIKNMKTTIVLVFSILLISLSLQGQPDKFNQKSGISRIDTAGLHHFFDNVQDSNYYNIPDKRNFFKGKNNDRFFDLSPKNRYQDPLRFKNYPDFVIVEEDPSHDRSFDNMPIIKPDTNGKLQLIKPDTTVKYYLRIMNPYTRIISK